jgi:UDP-2-acetamido-2-deoxy-ribo-hexuluronate aminotransferase
VKPHAPTLAEIPFTDLKAQYAALKPSIDVRLQQVLQHGQYIMGPEVAQLEAQLAAFVGVPHCITVASGTEALLIALMALGIGPGDEVITTPFTFAATAETIVLAGAKPVFVDVEAATANIDVALIAAQITPATKAIMPVSLYGQVADMQAINTLAAQHGLAVVEDAAQSFGAVYEGQRSCGLSTFAATSFFPSKPLGCYGDGGALFTADAALAQAAREIRVHGQSARYHHTRVGVGGRLDTLQAAVLLAKLERFDWELQRRAFLGARYDQLLQAALPQLPRISVRPGRNSVFAQYTVRLSGAEQRANVQKTLKAAGVPTAVHYPLPLHHQPAYAAHCCPGCCPVSSLLASQVISLPMSADLTEADQDRVVDALVAALVDALARSLAPALPA